MARMREDGNIEFIGRKDHQVKIRGQRLELGEIEALLRENPSVSDCVVSVRGELPDEKYLVAYIIPVVGNTPSSSELLDFARQRLPGFMTPRAFVYLKAFPLTPNGKLDRLALPDPAKAGTGAACSVNGLDAPFNPIEKSIAHIWKDLLKLVTLESTMITLLSAETRLLSVRMFTRIERDLGVRLPYTSLFRATTIAQIARLIVDRMKMT